MSEATNASWRSRRLILRDLETRGPAPRSRSACRKARRGRTLGLVGIIESEAPWPPSPVPRPRVRALRRRQPGPSRAHPPRRSSWARSWGSSSAPPPSTSACASASPSPRPIPIAGRSRSRSSARLSRVLGCRASILENNIVQTAGSAGESIAGGVTFTMPALMLPGLRAGLDAHARARRCCGGVLGVLMMIPLRRYLIVKEHGVLTYPEGTACAEVLIAGERGARRRGSIFTGLFAGALYKFLDRDPGLLERVPRERARLPSPQGAIRLDTDPAAARRRLHHRLPVVGDHGRRGLLSSLVLIPAIALFGDGRADAALSRDRAHRRDGAGRHLGRATSATSARARWPRAASSTWRAPCPPSSTPSAPRSATCGRSTATAARLGTADGARHPDQRGADRQRRAGRLP